MDLISVGLFLGETADEASGLVELFSALSKILKINHLFM